jgi:hypothetical protein
MAGVGAAVLAFKSWNEVMGIVERLKETAFQLEKLTGIAWNAEKDVKRFQLAIDNLSANFPNLSRNIKDAYDAISKLANAASMPGFALFKAALDAINTATALATGRSREMDDALASMNRRNIEAGAGLIKNAADMRNFGGAVAEASISSKGATSAASALSAEVDKAGQSSKRAAKHHLESSIATLDMAIAKREAKNRIDDYNKALDKAADIGIKYNGVTYEQIRLNIQAADAVFKYFRVLESAPDMGGIAAGIKLPEFKQPDFGYKPFGGGAPNVGEGGMMTKEQAEAVKARYKDVSKTGQAAMRQVSLVVNDLARGITDVIFKGGKLGDMFKSVASQAAQSITRLLIEGALTKLSSKIMDVGGLFGKVFGGATSVGGSVFSAASSAGGGAASALGGGASSIVGGIASAGISSIVGAVAGVGSLVSGIVGNFQFMAMNRTLDLIEKEVRYSQIHLLHLLENANEYWPNLRNAWESLVRMEARQMSPAGAGASVVINVNGGDPRQMLEDITRHLKLVGVIPR